MGVKWYLIGVSICISLKISEVHLYIFFAEMSIQVLFLFCNGFGFVVAVEL